MKTLDLGKVSIVPRGEYDASTEYHPLDLISYQGSGYLVLKTATGVTPVVGEYYQLISSKGDKGEKGDKGDTGARGATGSTGSSGSNATINGYKSITLKGGTGISVTNSGSTCTISQSSSSAKIAYGKYNGSDTGSADTTRTISVGFQPKIFIINTYSRSLYTRSTDSFVWDVPYGKSGGDPITWTSTGLTIGGYNISSYTYYWAAIG